MTNPGAQRMKQACAIGSLWNNKPTMWLQESLFDKVVPLDGQEVKPFRELSFLASLSSPGRRTV